MRYYFFLSIFFSLNFAFSQSFSVSSPIPIGEGYGFNHPQIEITNDGKPIVLWTDQVLKKLYISKQNDPFSFNSAMEISPIGLEVQSYNWSGPDLAIEGDNIYVVFRSQGYDTGHIYLVKSTDNGNTFSDTVRIDQVPGFAQYPDISVHNDSLWITYMDHDIDGSNPQYKVVRSFDGGATFQPQVIAGEIVGNEACDCCQPEIIVNDNFVVVFFRNNDNNIRDIKGVVSYDRGQTFSNWISVDDHNWSINACPSTGPDARFTDENTSITAYKSQVSGEPRIFINAFDYESNQSLGEVQITDATNSNLLLNYPQVASINNVIGIVWEGKGLGKDIFVNTSSSGINGLLPANAFNVTNQNGTQAKPDIALSNHSFHLVYTDYSDYKIKYVKLEYLLSNKEESTIEAFKIYPNPMQNFATLINHSNQKSYVELMTRDGKIISYFILEKQTEKQIDLSNYANGIYFLKLSLDNGETVTKKIIKQ